VKYLLGDDDESIHLYLKDILEPFAATDSALDGARAIELFEHSLAPGGEPYDAVFLDILMPGMDGHAVAARLRELERGRENGGEFKLVMITALSDTRNLSKAFFKGFASCYIVKPFEREAVLNELRVNKIIP
jgi:two-component system chemotaxis response regulator CheY